MCANEKADQMTELLRKGRYLVSLAGTPREVSHALELRARVFRGGAPDGDIFDERCAHVLLQDADSGVLLGCFRMQEFASGAEIDMSYAAQTYDLKRLSAFSGRMLEVGRFCIDPAHEDADLLRVAWGALTLHVDGRGIDLLFGCSSFEGADVTAHTGALETLRGHLAPACWRPGVKAREVARFDDLPVVARDPAGLPPMLRSYLSMGGWVSDHAVIDRDLDTLHVFTGVEVAAIPPARKRLLRALVDGAL